MELSSQGQKSRSKFKDSGLKNLKKCSKYCSTLFQMEFKFPFKYLLMVVLDPMQDLVNL